MDKNVLRNVLGQDQEPMWKELKAKKAVALLGNVINFSITESLIQVLDQWQPSVDDADDKSLYE